MSQRLTKAFVLAAITFVAYIPAIRGSFVWDDDYHVTENQPLRSLAGLAQIWLHPGVTPQYYPMTHTTFWIEWHLWGNHPLGYHLDNVLLHIANAILIWILLERLDVACAFAAALIFAVHPVHVESVAWITERKNVLSALFYLPALRAYLRFDETRNPRAHAIAFALFVAAILSKSVTASLPAAILLIIYWKRGRIIWRDVAPLLPFFVAGLIMSAITTLMEKFVVGARGPEFVLTFSQRIRIAGQAICFYARELVWPSPLMFSYPRWPIESLSWIYPLAVVVVVVALALSRKRLGRGPLVAVLYFIGTLMPALGFINVLPMLYSFVADHFQYLASIGLITLALSAAGRMRFRTPLVVAATPILAALTFHQSQIYKDQETLWLDTLAKNPSSWMAHNNLGMVYLTRGDLPDAEQHFRESLKLNPHNEHARGNLELALFARGKTQLSQGQFAQAAESFAEVIQLEPDLPEAHINLGVALASQGKFADAINHFRRALELNPNLAEARQNLAAAQRHLATTQSGK